MSDKKTTGKTAPKKAAPKKEPMSREALGIAMPTPPKKKAVIEKVEALLEPAKESPKKSVISSLPVLGAAKVTPPAQVIVSETTVKLAEPDPATGPNQKFPYAIKVVDKGKVYFDRFKTAKERDRRRGALEKRVTSIENVEWEAPLGNPQGIWINAGAVIKAPDQKKGPTLVKGADRDPSVSKRVTPGAAIITWRIARSVRVGQPGFFLQGGSYANADGTGRFTVGAEEHFKDLRKAKEAQVAKLPPSDDPEEVPGKGTKAK